MVRSVTALAVGLMCLAAPLGAQVKLVVRADGSKHIYNMPSQRRSSGGSDLTYLAKQRNRPSTYDPLIKKHCDQYKVDPVLAKAVIQVESGFNPAAVSNKGARGLMQLMPGTAKRFRVAKVHDPDENIRGGVAYLAFLQRLFPNDLRNVLAAYNAGENAVARYGGIPPYGETQSYVQRALTVYHGKPYGGVGTIRLNGGKGGKLGGGFKAATRKPVMTVASARPPARGRRSGNSR
jgi:soluble lytic murein transglycosylase-like protein